MEFCCCVWAGAPGCYLEMLDMLQNRYVGLFGPSLAAFLESLTHHQNVASLNLFCRHYFAAMHPEFFWADWCIHETHKGAPMVGHEQKNFQNMYLQVAL